MRQGQVAYFVDKAVRASFEDYYQRRQAALSLYIQDILKAKEQEVIRLVQTFFYIAKIEENTDIFLPVDRSVYIHTAEDLKRLVQHCNTVCDNFSERSDY